MIKLDLTSRPLGQIDFTARPLAQVALGLPFGQVDLSPKAVARVSLPVFPEIITQDFLSSDGSFITSDGEGLGW